ncbi:WxL domain-containing protein [Lactiplantibacillus plantarum]|nr:WxL domain-containing protein [Lactiplantibacillus plantarum]
MRKLIKACGLMVISMLVGLGIVTSALAAKTAPQSPSSPPSSVLGLNLSGGFSQQPIDSNVIGGNSVTLSVRAQRSALEAATSLLSGRKYVWWESTDEGQTYQKIGTNSRTYTFNAPQVTKTTHLYFQVQYDFSGVGAFPDYWSKIAKVTVTPARVVTTGIKVTSDDAWLNNAQTTMVHAALTPEEATDPITWKSSDPSLAAVDEYGNVTAADAATDNSGQADDHGTVTITGTSNGLSDSVKILVGALQDVTVVEGTPATFTLPALPEGVTVSNWYRVKNSKATALNVTDMSYTVKVPTNADDDGTAYYASLSYPVNGKPQTVTTNAALLTVKSGGRLSLSAVPNFNFGTLNLQRLAQGTDLATDPTAVKANDGNDGNNDYRLAVVDDRTVGADWQLMASLSPFTAGNTTIKTARLMLKDSTGVLNQTIPTDGSTTSVYRQTGHQSQTFDVAPSSLQLPATPLATPGEYQSIITWTLAIVPAA